MWCMNGLVRLPQSRHSLPSNINRPPFFAPANSCLTPEILLLWPPSEKPRAMLQPNQRDRLFKRQAPRHRMPSRTTTKSAATAQLTGVGKILHRYETKARPVAVTPTERPINDVKRSWQTMFFVLRAFHTLPPQCPAFSAPTFKNLRSILFSPDAMKIFRASRMVSYK